MRLIPLLAAAILTASAFAQQRQPALRPLPPGTSSLRGTVTDAVSKEPVSGCTIYANTVIGTPGPANTRSSSVVTGADGAFEFSGIVDGNYFLRADCPTHVLVMCMRAPDSAGPCVPTALFKDQQRADIDFKVTPGATIRGRVVTSDGKPVPRTGVRMGGPFLGPSVVMVQGTVTKDDGTFELTRMPEGVWALEADVPPAPGAARSLLVYYPGVLTRDEAGSVEVLTGKVVEGVVITVPPILERTLTVRIPPPDATMTDVNVAVVRAEPLMTRRLDIDAEGQTTVKGLIEGRYVVVATALSGKERWADFQSFDFLEESLDIALQLRPTGRIRGRVMADGGGVPPLEGASIGAVWMDNDAALNPLTPEEGPVALDGSFEIAGVFGRRVMQLGSFDPGWRIQAVMHGKTDVTAAGLDVAPNDTAEVTIVVRPR